MKNILITGGAKGIGRGIVEELIEKKEEITILLHYNHSETEARKLMKQLENMGIKFFCYQADLTNPQKAQDMVKYFIEKVEHIDVLINNAGISQIKLFTDITLEDWRNMIETNINSIFYLTKEVVKNMIHYKNGCIINISSIWGQTGASCEVHYSTTKGAVNSFTKALAKELGPSNIRVNAIAPGYFETDMNREITQETKKEIIDATPLEKTGEPREIGKCVKWLIEDSFTTGQIISINGVFYI